MGLIFGDTNALGSLAPQDRYEFVASFRKFVIAARKTHPKRNQLHIHQDEECLALLWGNVFQPHPQTPNPALHAYQVFIRKGAAGIYCVDGSFLFAVYAKREESLTVFSERFGILPLYYRAQGAGILFSTAPSLLFADFTPDQADLSSVHDYIRHGTLLGDKTFSKNVHLLLGGTKLRFMHGDIQKERLFLFRYDEENADHNCGRLIEDVAGAYTEALRKRIPSSLEHVCVFLSGGIDSRFLLASLNQVSPERVACYSFGQPDAGETAIAREVAGIGGNAFFPIVLSPEDFVSHAEDYLRLTTGSDTFPQGYILHAIKSIKHPAFLTGFSLDALIGGTFLYEIPEQSGSTQLSACVQSYEKALKMQVFNQEEFNDLCVASKNSPARHEGNMRQTASAYDGYRVCDVLQAFAVQARALRLVLNRESVPALFMDELFPSTDMNFLAALVKIPSAYRKNHSLYRELLMKKFPEYCEVPYNNTGLPISAPLKAWKESQAREAEKEKRYAARQAQSAQKGHSLYYSHYYSDFNGYSRYNTTWTALIRSALLGDDTYITREWFKKSYIEEIIRQHMSNAKNHRSKLIYLTSLELFMRQASQR